MTETLIKSLKSGEGEIYIVADGRRTLFAKCAATVDVYERVKQIDILGGGSYDVLVGRSVKLFCADVETTRTADVAFLQGVSAFDFSGRFQRKDGIFEVLAFAVVPVTIDLCGGGWAFHVNGAAVILDKLISF